MYLQRIKAFDYDNNEYYVPNGKYNQLAKYDELQIPNCTRYANLRAYEMCGRLVEGVATKSGYGWGNAKTWYDNTSLPKGSQLKEGSIAVFDGNRGHVAVVEKVNDATHGDLSESSYSKNKNLRDWHFFNYRNNVELVVGKATIKGVGALLGFIYLPYEDNDNRVCRNTEKEQVEIIDTVVNVRKSPNGDIANQGCYCPIGIFDVISVSYDGEYNWYEIGENCWVREGEWLKHYTVDTADYKAKYDELLIKYNQLNEKVNKAIETLS